VSAAPAPVAARIDALLAQRVQAGERFFAAEAGRLARCCHAETDRRTAPMPATSPSSSSIP
jgi:hypothetical protein